MPPTRWRARIKGESYRNNAIKMKVLKKFLRKENNAKKEGSILFSFFCIFVISTGSED